MSQNSWADQLPDRDARIAAEKAARQGRSKRRRPQLSRSWGKGRRQQTEQVSQTPPPAPTAPAPIKPFAEPKNKGRLSKVASVGGGTANSLLVGIQPINAITIYLMLVWVMKDAGLLHDVTPKGLALGLAFTVVELVLLKALLWTIDTVKSKELMLIYGVVIGVAVVAVFKLYADKFPGVGTSTMLVFGGVIAYADPLGFIHNKSRLDERAQELDADREKFDAERAAFNASCEATSQQLAQAVIDAANLNNRLRNQKQRTDDEIEEEVKRQVDRFKAELKKAGEDFLGLVQTKEAYEAATAEAQTVMDRYQVTRAQIEAEVREELERNMANRAGFTQGPATLPTDNDGHPVHPVVTQSGEGVGYMPE